MSKKTDPLKPALRTVHAGTLSVDIIAVDTPFGGLTVGVMAPAPPPEEEDVTTTKKAPRGSRSISPPSPTLDLAALLHGPGAGAPVESVRLDKGRLRVPGSISIGEQKIWKAATSGPVISLRPGCPPTGETRVDLDERKRLRLPARLLTSVGLAESDWVVLLADSTRGGNANRLLVLSATRAHNLLTRIINQTFEWS